VAEYNFVGSVNGNSHLNKASEKWPIIVENNMQEHEFWEELHMMENLTIDDEPDRKKREDTFAKYKTHFYDLCLYLILLPESVWARIRQVKMKTHRILEVAIKVLSSDAKAVSDYLMDKDRVYTKGAFDLDPTEERIIQQFRIGVKLHLGELKMKTIIGFIASHKTENAVVGKGSK
jgi:hypothetical protein